MEDQGGAYQTEAKAWRDDRNQHRDREARKDNERSAPCKTPRTRGHLRGVRVSQHLVLEDVVGNVDSDEQPCIKHYSGRGKPGSRNPSGRKRQERHHEEMEEVDPYQSQRRRTYEPHKVMVVYPNNGDE